MTKEQYSSNQILVVNMASSFLSLAVTFGISFFLSPYIVETVGVEAYGFVGLANSFISYASLITIALNALSGRFITIAIHEQNYEKANRYYSSVFLANCLISAVLLLIGTIVWVYLEYLISIPESILWDVKLLFAALFINCIVSTVGSVFSVSTFATNKLYISSFRSIESSLIRAVVLIGLFAFFSPRAYYLGITSLLASVYCMGFNIHYMHKLLPALHIKRSSFDFAAVIELVSSGVWSLINRLGQIFADGLDLLVTNLFIDATAMGVLSLAKTVPALITSVVGSLVSVFSPNFTILYARNKHAELVAAVKQSIKIMGVITNLPVIVLVVCGEHFFSLWQPTQNATQLQVLSILTIGCSIFSGGINCIYNIFTVVNKLKANSLVVVISGLLSVLITFILVKFTSLGIYAVAGTSTIVAIIRNLAFTAPYGAKCLNLKWYVFYPDIFRPVVFVVASTVLSSIVLSIIPSGGWLMLIVRAAITGTLSIAFGFFIVLSKSDREIIISKFTKGRC